MFVSLCQTKYHRGVKGKREDNFTSMQWRLGQINATNLGEDKIPGVVIVKTNTATYKRSVNLPMDI